MTQTPPDEAPLPPQKRPRNVATLRALALAAGVAALVWATAAVLCANRGFDLTDESFYLLTYRWWNDNYDNFTGAQYIYGPVFELFGFNIAALRIFKLLTLLLAHGLFGWTFMRWLRLHRPEAPSTWWWEVAGVSAIVACAGMVYSWLPLSPGYNDLALACSVLAAGAVLQIVRDIAVRARPAWWASLGLGAVAAVMVLGKWSSSLLTLTLVGLTVTVVAIAGRLGWRRYFFVVVLAMTGAFAVFGFINFALVPFSTLVPPLLKVNSLVAASSNSPTILISHYWNGATLLAENILQQHWPILIVAIVVPFLRRRKRLSSGLAAVAIGVSVVQVIRHDGLRAGPLNLAAITVTVFAPLVVVAIVGFASAVGRRWKDGGSPWRDTPVREQLGCASVFGLLLVLPVAQAAGTGNPVHYLAMTGLGVWMAVGIAVLTGLQVSALGARTLVAGTLAMLVVATSLIAVDGLWNRPYRTTGYAASTAVVDDVPALSSVRLDPETAQTYAELHALLQPWIEPAGRAMMAFDQLAGVVYLLDGRSVGESWYVPARSTPGIRRACAGGKPWWGDRKPVIIFNRSVRPPERRAIGACGLSLRDDYRRLTFDKLHLQIYVPLEDKATK